MDSDAISAELEAMTSKRASLKDKLKKRRAALGSILSSATASPSASSAASAPPSSTPAAPASSVAKSTSTTSAVSVSADVEKSQKAREATGKDTDVQVPAAKRAKHDVAAGKASRKKSSGTTEAGVVSERKTTTTESSVSDKTSSSTRPTPSSDQDDILSLLSQQSAKEKADKQQREEILELLSQPTTKEKSLMDTFRSQSGTGVKEFCSHSTKLECMKLNAAERPCDKLHFAKIIQPHTDESLGDCSFLNTCFHMDSCKYIHYEVDAEDMRSQKRLQANARLGRLAPGSSSSSLGGGAGAAAAQPVVQSRHLLETMKLVPPQWVQCDLRGLNLSVLGKFSVVMADPPWDIHMELPYGTMSDDEMRQLPVPSLQDDGLIFLWVTGRAMEMGRECLKLWGYERVDELIWVKTNQLQRIIRTGRTGHWLNHGKEHCLVGKKGDLKLNRGLDCDVIVAEVRATSHKPDEIYGIIERLSPGTRKIELFGRPHNVQPNWVTLGNQLDGVVIHDEEMLARWHEAYPNGYEFVKGMVLHPRQQP